MQRMETNDAEVTDRVLEMRDLPDSDRQTQRQADELEDAKLAPQEYADEFRNRMAMISGLEREVSTVLDQVEQLQDRIERREESDEFERDKEDNAIDTEDYNRVRDWAEHLLRLAQKLTLERKLYDTVAWDQHGLIDTQMFLANSREVTENVKEISDNMAEAFQSNIDRQVDAFDAATERMAGAVEDIAGQVEQLVEENRREKRAVSRLLDAVESVEVDQDEVDRLREEVERLERELEQQSRPDAGDGRQSGGHRGGGRREAEPEPDPDVVDDLSDVEEKVLRKLQDGVSVSDIPTHLRIKKDRVQEIVDTLDEKGLLPPGVG